MNITKKQLFVITIILAVLLVVAVCVSIWALFFRDGGTPIPPDYPPMETEKNQKPLEDDISDKLDSSTGGGAVNVTYNVNATAYLSEGRISLLYANPRASNQNVALTVMVGGVVVARSQLITPGHAVEELELDEAAAGILSAGRYDAELLISAYAPSSGEKAMVDMRGRVNLTVVE